MASHSSNANLGFNGCPSGNNGSEVAGETLTKGLLTIEKGLTKSLRCTVVQKEELFFFGHEGRRLRSFYLLFFYKVSIIPVVTSTEEGQPCTKLMDHITDMAHEAPLKICFFLETPSPAPSLFTGDRRQASMRTSYFSWALHYLA